MRISTDDSDSPLVEKVRFLPPGWDLLGDDELLALFADLRATIATAPTRRASSKATPAEPKKSRAKGFIIYSEQEAANDVSIEDPSIE